MEEQENDQETFDITVSDITSVNLDTSYLEKNISKREAVNYNIECNLESHMNKNIFSENAKISLRGKICLETRNIVFLLLQIVACTILISIVIQHRFIVSRKVKNCQGFTTEKPIDSILSTRSGDPTKESFQSPMNYDSAEISRCKGIDISSVGEYRQRVLHIEDNDRICIHINLKQAHGWDIGTALPRTNQVSEITIKGCINLFPLFVIIKGFPAVTKLTIIETGQGSCDHKQILERRQSKTYLENLTELKFHNITFCQQIFAFISKRFLITDLVNLEIDSTAIKDEGGYGFQELLGQAMFSLKTMHLRNVPFTDVILRDLPHVLLGLEKIQLNFETKTNLDQHLLTQLSKHTPNLRSLISTNGYISSHQLSKIYDLKKIEQLDIGLHVPMNLESIDVTSILPHLPKLKHLELSLNFENSRKCVVTKNSNLKTNVTFNLYSNCKLIIKSLKSK